jgi:hypothetical protein
LRTAASTSGRNDSVSQAPCVAIQHDVFDSADFIALGRLNLLPNKFAGLNVTGAAGSSALSLRRHGGHRQTQKENDGSSYQ